MKVSLAWLKELVDYDLSPKELANKLSLISIGVKEQTQDFLELDLTYNRGDLLSLRGVAREIAVATNSRLLFLAPSPKAYRWEGKNLPQSPAEVKDEKLCPVYCVAKIERLNVEPSSDELVKKLMDSGIRSVNNVADITNLVMLEYGQPMHSFDASAVKDETLIVRVAKQEEKIITLDGKERILDRADLLIADSKKPLGLAGIMGGKDSEVSETTKTILLEAAIFNPVSNRDASKRHGLYSEASKRFQHGLTKTNLLQALSAAIKMYEALGGKLTAITLAGNLEDEIKTIQLTQQKISSLIGIEIAPGQVEDSLGKLGFTLATQGETLRAWDVTVPYWRLDINIEEDLIEEVARMYGYDKIKGKALVNEKATPLDQSFYELIYKLKVALKETGLTEVSTYSFYSTAVLDNLDLDKDNLIRIANPISSETEYMRNSLWPNLLEVTAKNIKNGVKNIAIFELAKTYSPQKGDLPHENYHLSIALCNETSDPIQELYQIAKSLSLHLEGVKQGALQLNPREYFHPTRYTDSMAEIHPRFVNKFGVEQRIAVLEIELECYSNPN